MSRPIWTEELVKRQVLLILGRVPSLRIRNVRSGIRSQPGRTAAIELRVLINKVPYQLYIDPQSNGSPSILQAAVGRIMRTAPASANSITYNILAAPYISDVGMQFCRQRGVGCFDLVGNCYLCFGPAYIEVSGKPNRPTEESEPSLFSPKSSRIGRVLLSAPSRQWQVQELASEALVSLGLVSKIKKQLISDGYVIEENKLLKLVAPAALLEEWSAHYSFRKNQRFEYYSLLDPPKLESELQTLCSRLKIRSAFALFSGASRVAPHVRIDKSFFYVEKAIEDLEKALDLKQGVSGSNLTLLIPYDDGVFYGTREIGGASIVSDIQLYLDLKSFKGRGQEAADVLYRSRIEPTWSTRH